MYYECLCWILSRGSVLVCLVVHGLHARTYGCPVRAWQYWQCKYGGGGRVVPKIIGVDLAVCFELYPRNHRPCLCLGSSVDRPF